MPLNEQDVQTVLAAIRETYAKAEQLIVIAQAIKKDMQKILDDVRD